MAFTATRIQYPTEGDLFQPHIDLKHLADTLRVIVPVADRDEAETIAAGYNPSPTNPLYVDRADTGVVER
ncbi:MAG TPA: hypothetical protein VK054_05055, partial [Beutenbergiaceae bacterium]|nr:hypothetical protein [Beutenbergiaceae bacterium]